MLELQASPGSDIVTGQVSSGSALSTRVGREQKVGSQILMQLPAQGVGRKKEYSKKVRASVYEAMSASCLLWEGKQKGPYLLKNCDPGKPFSSDLL